ncbi:MAG TPA: RNA methyltransferase [Polyangiaceae bacterium]|nr:RNA methyltransferase [Polyangiaceae bacterium]
MNVIRVDSATDERLAGYSLIGDERALAGRGWFVAEGRYVVERLIAGRRHELVSLLVNDAALAALAPHLGAVTAPIYVCAPRLFEPLTGHHFHRGCLALAVRPAPAPPLLLARGARSLVVLDRVGNPDNVGSIFRSALALGADGLWLGPGCADPFGRKAIRTSMAAALAMPFATLGGGAACTQHLVELRDAGFELLALSPREPGVELGELSSAGVPVRFALLLGAEGEGLAPELEALATRRLRIAMRPGVDSLNVGVAAGIALHTLRAR